MSNAGSLLDMLTSQLAGGGIDQISRQLGIKRSQTEQVVAGALPMFVEGLARNAGNSSGAASLAGALDRDHDGSILDDVIGFLGQGSAASSAGAGILGHVFGHRQGAMESVLAKSSGLDIGSVGQILAMLAPLVMGALGRSQRQQGFDPRGLADLLGQERQVAHDSSPEAMDVLGSLFDSDGDGQAIDDLLDLGVGLLGGLLGRTRR